MNSEHKTIFKNRYVHALAKSATAERIENRRLTRGVWNLTDELFGSASLLLCTYDVEFVTLQFIQ